MGKSALIIMLLRELEKEFGKLASLLPDAIIASRNVGDAFLGERG